jgi:glutathione S-transferase
MKLYHGKGTCSLGILVILEELGLHYELVTLDMANREQASPAYLARSPKGKVPLLELPGGDHLSEWPAIAAYLARTTQGPDLLPSGALGHARTLEAVDYIVATTHMQGFTRMVRPGLFTPNAADFDQVKARGREIVDQGLALMGRRLAGQDYLLGELTIADAALFYVERWMAALMGATLPLPVHAHYERMLRREPVKRALARGE